MWRFLVDTIKLPLVEGGLCIHKNTRERESERSYEYRQRQNLTHTFKNSISCAMGEGERMKLKDTKKSEDLIDVATRKLA